MTKVRIINDLTGDISEEMNLFDARLKVKKQPGFSLFGSRKRTGGNIYKK